MSDPWFKFYPTDWRADPALRMCSPAARGVWIDMICLMHEATPYGHLLVNGRCPTDAQIAVLLGLPPEQFSETQGELEQAGVFSRTKDGVIYSRKMTRWAKKAATARKNGRKGGNPTLSGKRENPASDNPPVKGGDKPQKPEARSQSKKREAKASPKKGTRLPENWTLPRQYGEWALAEGWAEPVIRLEAEKFRDYWHSLSGQKAVKLDWQATWRNWMRNSNSPKIINGGNHDQSPGNRAAPKSDPTLDAISIAARSRRSPGAAGV